MLLCVLFVKINHLDKDIWREFILNSCKSKLLCAEGLTQQDHTTSLNLIISQDEGIKKSGEENLWLQPALMSPSKYSDPVTKIVKTGDWRGKGVGRESSRQVKVGRNPSAVGQTWVHREALTSKAQTLAQLLAHHKEQMWRAKKPAPCNRPSGQAKYCLNAPPFYLPLAHLYCPWSHIGTLQSLSTGRGIYGGAIRAISSTGKQWPTLVVFDSVRSTAGVNGTQQNSTPTTQWCLSLSAKVTSNKHCKQRGATKRRHRIKGLVSAQSHRNTSLVPNCLLHSEANISGHKQLSKA